MKAVAEMVEKRYNAAKEKGIEFPPVEDQKIQNIIKALDVLYVRSMKSLGFIWTMCENMDIYINNNGECSEKAFYLYFVFLRIGRSVGVISE